MDMEVRPGLPNELCRRQPRCGDKWHLVPQVLITDKLKSYAAAKKMVVAGVEHR